MTIIKQILKSKKMSQNRLSQIARLPSSNLSLIINGKMTACPAWRKRISEALEVPEHILFPKEDE